jgi:phospholipase/carboxylesterase
MIPPQNTERLAEILREAGADLDLRWRDTGHPLTYEELAEARDWLAGVLPDLTAELDR